MKPRRLLPFTAAITCVLTVSAHAVDRIKANNTNALNLGTAWGGTAPGTGDVGVWNSTVSATNVAGSPTLTALGGDLSWQGIRIANVGGTANQNGTNSGIQITNASSANTLTLGSAGIDMSAATQALQIQSKITLGASQTWTVNDANTNASPFGFQNNEDLAFNAQVGGAAFNLGGNTLATAGTGQITITSGYTLSNGIINVGNNLLVIQSGGSRTTTVNSNVTLNVAANSQLRLQANSGASNIGLVSSAPINVSGTGSKLTFLVNNGTASFTQSGALAFGAGSTFDLLPGPPSGTSAGNMTVSAPISVTGASTWTLSGINAATQGALFSGPLSGAGSITHANTSTATHGQIRFTGDNSGFTGSLTLNGLSGNRSLRLASATAGSAAATWSVAAANTLQVDGVAVNLGTLNGAGTVTNSHATNVAGITVGSGTFSGAITNGTPLLGMALTKNTAGTLTLSGNGNTFTGNTLISGGKLVATQTGALSTSSAISVNGSGAIFDGTGTMGAVTVADNLGTIQNGNGTSGALTLSSLTFNGDGTLNVVTSSATPSARVIVTGALTTTPGSGTIIVNGSGSWTNGVNNLLSYGSGGALLTDFTAGAFTGFTSRQSAGALSLSGNNLSLTVIGDSPKWTGSDNGNWVVGTTGASGNWQLITAATQTDFIANDIVLFDDTAPGTKTVNVSAANVSVGSAEFNTATAYTLTGAFGLSAGTIAKNGSGALTIENANTTSGGVQLNTGTLNVNHADALGSGALTIAGGTTLNNTSGSAKVATNAQNWNGDFTFTGTNDLTLGTAAMNASRQVTVSAGTLSVGGITGSGFGLTKEGAGALAVGASTYTGATVVNGGVLRATNAASFSGTSSITLADTAGVALDLNGINQTINTITGGGATGGDINLNGAVLTTGTAASNAFAGDLTGAGGLTKQGTGTLTLSGDKSGYTGTTTINTGVLDVGTVSGMFGSTMNINNGTVLQANGSITGTVGTGNQIVSGNGGFAARGGNLTVNFGGAGATINLDGSGNVFGNGLVLGSSTADSRVTIQNGIGINNNNGTRTITVNPGTGTDSAEISGVISNGTAGGNNGIVKAGTGNLILSNANTYTGSTTINAGRIVLGHAQALQFSALNTASAGKLTATGFATPTLGGLTGSVALATVIDTGYSGITTLTLNPQTGQSPAYSGIIADGAVGMNLVKSGAGTQTLSGNNSYTGGTSVNQGALAIGHNSGFGTGSVAIASGATVSNSAALSGLANTFTGSGSFTTGTGQATITGNWSGFSGSVTTVSNADMVFNGAFSSGVSVTTSENAAYVNNYNLNNTNGMIVQNQTGTTGTYKLGSYASAVGSNLRNAGAATGSVIFEIGNLGTNTTVAGTIGGGAQTVSLTKVGSGTLTLGGNNTYIGATLVSAGTLLVNGALAASAVTVEGAATIGGTGALGGSLHFDTGSLLTISDFNDPLSITGAVTFGSGFGIDNLLGITWGALDLNTPYTVLTNSTDFSLAGLDNFGIANAYNVGGGRSAYFQNGSLQLVIIPEPSVALLGGISMLALLRRRRLS